MKPPPPIPHELEFVTHIASAVAHAASIALPPLSRIFTPAFEAGSLSDTTIAWLACADQAAAAAGVAVTGAPAGEAGVFAIAVGVDPASEATAQSTQIRNASEELGGEHTRCPNMRGFTNSRRERKKAGRAARPIGDALDFHAATCFDRAVQTVHAGNLRRLQWISRK